MLIEKVLIGGWFQRTTLHISEIYDFLRTGTSKLSALDSGKLKKYHDDLKVTDIHYCIDGMERLKITTTEDVGIDIFEDGLIILYTNGSIEVKPESVGTDLGQLSEYYEKKLSPALNYLFSLGAPVPKELANIKTVHPYFFILDQVPRAKIAEFLGQIEVERYLETSNSHYDLFRGDRFYIINRKKVSLSTTASFVEEQIFLKEFKSQLHHYLNIHRVIWGRIDKIKAKKTIKGRDIGKVRSEIERYGKTINLIEARINQMGTYLSTRAKIAHKDPSLAPFRKSIEYRYETLANTLEYSKHIWHMTKNHIGSALSLLSDMHQEVTNTSLENLTVVMIIGAGAGLIQILEASGITLFGVICLVVLLVALYAVIKWVRWRNSHNSYEYNEVDYRVDIKGD